MSTEVKDYRHIRFDRSKRSSIEFDMVPLRYILDSFGMDHDPLQLHRVNFYVMLVIESGEGVHTIDFADYPYSKGSVITIRKNQIQKFHQSDAEGSIFIFTEAFLLSHLEYESARVIPTVFNELLFDQVSHFNSDEFIDFQSLVRNISGEFSREIDFQSSGILRNYLQIFVAQIYRHRLAHSVRNFNDKHMSQFLQFQELVEESEGERKKVSYFAEQLNITPRTLNTITHEIIGKSSKQFVDESLMMKIKRMLLNTSLSVKEVAYQSGFDEPSNMYKFFKKHVGNTPEEFRGIHSV
ncbi:MAG: helix-turn-helix transcriptional regulator [Bacteroidota bacterium]